MVASTSFSFGLVVLQFEPFKKSYYENLKIKYILFKFDMCCDGKLKIN